MYEREGYTMYEFEPILRRLKDAKSASGLTNKELSEKSSVPLGTVNKILSGDTEEPKLPAIMALAEALDVSVDYLIYGERRDQPASASSSDTVSKIVALLSEMNVDGQEEVLKFARYTLSQPEYKKDYKPRSMAKEA